MGYRIPLLVVPCLQLQQFLRAFDSRLSRSKSQLNYSSEACAVNWADVICFHPKCWVKVDGFLSKEGQFHTIVYCFLVVSHGTLNTESSDHTMVCQQDSTHPADKNLHNRVDFFEQRA